MARPVKKGPRRPQGFGRRPKRSERLDRIELVEIESIASGGEGVARLSDGRAIFIHRTAPGDQVEVSVEADRPRWARGRLVRVLHPSSDRRDAPCPHYERCGGCTLEHLSYDAQLRVKGRIVADALRRIGGVAVEEPVVIPSPREFRYRNRVSFALKRIGNDTVFAGLHALHDPGRIVSIDGSCLLPEAPIGEVWDILRNSWGTGARMLPSGDSLRLTLRGTVTGEVSLLIEGGTLDGDAETLVASVPGLVSIWQRPDDHPLRLLAGQPSLRESWAGEEMELVGGAFLQVNRRAAPLLEEHVARIAGEVTGFEIIDAYCGIGVHARRFAREGARVTGVELDANAVGIAASKSAPGARFIAGQVEDVLPGLLPADLLVLNPPRTGVTGDALAAIEASPPTRIIYVSCDPATLARDLRRLSGTYSLASLRCFDLFPQTAHVETVAELVRVDFDS